MVVFPNCKINLGLHIIGKREDGFHDIETVFYPVRFFDVLEIIKNTGHSPEVEITLSGIPVDGKPEDNICIKAYLLLKQDHPQLPAIKMHLHKAIPLGAGLGGGSGDGAFVLKILNEKFQLGLSTDELMKYAATLGSDVPFFIIDKTCFATGRGEILEEIDTDLSRYSIVLVNPGIHVNTGWAFGQVQEHIHLLASSPGSLKTIVRQPIETWKDELKNDLENPVFEKHPVIKDIKETLYNKGAIYASMSGSGSTVYGIFGRSMTARLFPGTDYYEYLIKGNGF